MARRPHPKIEKSPTFAERLELLENNVAALDERCNGITARMEWMQIEQRKALGIGEQGPPRLPTTEEAWATPPRPRFRFLNGRWPQRDGNTYPQFDTTRRQGPVTYYESYVRRSPPATE